MANSTFAQATPHDIAEIPAYVIRPARASGSRYHAPRLSRTALTLRELRDLQRRSWSQRLVDGWRRRQGDATASGEAEAVTELRYRATARTPMLLPTARAPQVEHALDVSPRALGRMAAALATCVAAAGLGWTIGAQMQPAAASSARSIPASVLIAGQNLPTKLPRIEAKAPTTGGLEQGHRLARLTYVVQAGDSFRSVGLRFGLTPRTVRLVNQLPLGYRLRVGQQLMITPADGAVMTCQAGDQLDEIAHRYDLQPSLLLAANPGVGGNHLVAGQPLFIPGAQELRLPLPREMALAPRGYRNEGTARQRLTASRSLIGQFGNRVGALSWPAAGQISSPFGIRGYSFHPGMDICNAIGTPVHAAKAGLVVAAGWSGGYGYAVDIDHGGGVVTRYGHCSRLLVAAGQKVEAGEEIALMGSTGHSTGPHVHFEVRIQGRAVNPASFL